MRGKDEHLRGLDYVRRAAPVAYAVLMAFDGRPGGISNCYVLRLRHGDMEL